MYPLFMCGRGKKVKISPEAKIQDKATMTITNHRRPFHKDHWKGINVYFRSILVTYYDMRHQGQVNADSEIEERLELDLDFQYQLGVDKDMQNCLIKRFQCYQGTLSAEEENFVWDSPRLAIRTALINRAKLEILQKQRFKKVLPYIPKAHNQRVKALNMINSNLQVILTYLLAFEEKSQELLTMKKAVLKSFREKINLTISLIEDE